MIRRLTRPFWRDRFVLYDSDRQGDPSTPQEAYVDPGFCRDPDDSPQERLQVMQAHADALGRHEDLPKFTSPGEATAWLEALHAHPTYFLQGEVLAVQCPACKAVAGRLCVSLNEHPTYSWKVNPHQERILYFRGHAKRGLIGQ